MDKIRRLCWHCNNKLQALGQTNIKDQDGNIIVVHKICKDDAESSIRKITAYQKKRKVK
jgi:hypothetical protein